MLSESSFLYQGGINMDINNKKVFTATFALG